MYEHFRDIAPVWLILRLVEHDLHCAEHYPFGIFGDKDLTLTACHTGGVGVPVGRGFLAR